MDKNKKQTGKRKKNLLWPVKVANHLGPRASPWKSNMYVRGWSKKNVDGIAGLRC